MPSLVISSTISPQVLGGMLVTLPISSAKSMSLFSLLLAVLDVAVGVALGAFFWAGNLIMTFLTGCFFASTLGSSSFFLTILLKANGVLSSDSKSAITGSIWTYESFLFLPFSRTTSISAFMSFETSCTNLLAFPSYFSLLFRLNSVSTSRVFYCAVP